MVFIQLRFTPCKFTEPGSWGGDSLQTKGYLLSKVLDYYGKDNVTRYICVLETIDNKGAICDPHFHINLEVPCHQKTKDNFQKYVRKLSGGIKGAACYAVAYIEDPIDEDRWWRYCLKEVGSKVWFSKHGFQKDWISLARTLACDERARTIEFNKASMQRHIQKDSFRLKMFKNVTNTLKNQPISSNLDKHLYCLIIRYYQDNNKTPPFNNLDNIVIDYKLVAKIITPEEYYNIHH